MERALEVTGWLQQAYQELSESRTAAEKSSFAEKYQVKQSTKAKRVIAVYYFVLFYSR